MLTDIRVLIDLGMDPVSISIYVCRAAHLHAPLPPSLEVRCVGLSLDRIRTDCAGLDHLRHAHLPNGSDGRI